MKPLLLSLIHVTQDNIDRSQGATIRDTEKKADPVGGSGSTEEGWRENRSLKLGCGLTDNTVIQPDRHKDTIYLCDVAKRKAFTQESDHVVLGDSQCSI